MSDIKVTALRHAAEPLASLRLPKRELIVLPGIGSGLTRDGHGRIWAVGDRGPNLSVKLAVDRFGLSAQAAPQSSAKIMPCPDIGPAISELVLSSTSVEVVRTLPLKNGAGRPISGFPPPGSDHGATEPALDVSGTLLPADASGADSEGITALRDGSFIIGDEYGPSLLRVAGDGTVLERWVPDGCQASFAGAPYPVRPLLPRIAARRQLNRGFEALGLSPDESVLYLAFQSPLAHPDEAAHRTGRWVRIWKLAMSTGALIAEYAYPLDPPDSFRRDRAAGSLDWSDLKVSELAVLGEDRLLILERGSHTTKLQIVELDPGKCLDPAFAALETRPTLEQLSATAPAQVQLLDKRLLLSTDDYPEIGPDLEGMVLLAPDRLLLVNDNDFGIEDVPTRFWRVDLPSPLT